MTLQPLPESFFHIKTIMNNTNATRTEYTKIGDCLYKTLDCTSPREVWIDIKDLQVEDNPLYKAGDVIGKNNNRYIGVLDLFGGAATNNITIKVKDGGTINGQNEYVINQDKGYVKLFPQGDDPKDLIYSFTGNFKAIGGAT